ncbi:MULTISPECIES: DUF192 domain-containing protein [Halomonadaceae]|uniref:DUF192 domain-containing protein n=1 Tax=Halomonadaceae TaxID=28256 RepID=UPI001599309D|nr:MULTISPECIES: DUF192 domain-containing protein [Halomonas]QJQ95848.1 DUF192 domain-containing protein [Halomonas sp. PA5]
MSLTRREVLAAMAATLVMPKTLLAAGSNTGEMTWERAVLAIHSNQGPHRLEVEVAKSFAQRGRGLMDRDALDPDSGMLFLYRRPQPPRMGFWMFRTRIPLDIAFIGEDGSILNIATMAPCASSDPNHCPVTHAGVTYIAALEVNAGYFAEHGIAVGDCVVLPGREGMCQF